MDKIILKTAIAALVASVSASCMAGGVEDRKAAVSATYSVQDIAALAVASLPEADLYTCSAVWDGMLANYRRVSMDRSNVRIMIGGVGYYTIKKGTNASRNPEARMWNVSAEEICLLTSPSGCMPISNSPIPADVAAESFLLVDQAGESVRLEGAAEDAYQCVNAIVAAGTEFTERDLSAITSKAAAVTLYRDLIRGHIHDQVPRLLSVRFRKGEVDYVFANQTTLLAKAPPNINTKVVRLGQTVWDESKLLNVDYKIQITKGRGAQVVK